MIKTLTNKKYYFAKHDFTLVVCRPLRDFAKVLNKADVSQTCILDNPTDLLAIKLNFFTVVQTRLRDYIVSVCERFSNNLLF